MEGSLERLLNLKQTWPPYAIIVSGWSLSKKTSLKPLGQMNRNVVGSIY